jgi:two-component system sensor histidine kinase KdpD
VAGDLSVAGGPLEGRPVRVVAAATQAAWADEDQMVRVLYNLLTNAAKFSPPGTAVEVRVEDARASSNRAAMFAADVQPGVLVEVIDSGPGVAAADRGHVFNKFFRAGATRSTAPGTGLGLAICRGIVEAHGGHIWVQPGPGGRGACFSFAVPAAPPPAPRPATGGEQGTPAVGRRVKEAATV